MTSACAHLVPFLLRVALGQVTEATFTTNATPFDATWSLGAMGWLLQVWLQSDCYSLPAHLSWASTDKQLHVRGNGNKEQQQLR